MTELQKRLKDDLVAAMKAKDTTKRDFLKVIRSELTAAELKAQWENKPYGEAEEILGLRKMRKNAIECGEEQEVAILDTYLPQLMSEDDILKAIDDIVFNGEIDVNPKSMGRVMGLFSASFKGKADNKLVSKLVKEYLCQTKK